MSASSEEVVAASIGTSNLRTVASDSPSFARIDEAIGPSARSTRSLLSICACSRASDSPLLQPIASSVAT